jgi:hypothetical protein
MTTSSSAPAIPVRLLSSVAVVGRDNEPIYLRGDLCDVHVVDAGVVRADGSPPKSKAAGGIDDDGVDDEDGAGDGRTRSSPGPGEVRAYGGRGGGLLGRIMGRNRNGAAGPGREDAKRRRGGTNDENDVRDDDEDDDDDDPFGFFAGSNSADRRRRGDDDPASSAMSLTQQLVLHASLDRFEEMACRSNRGGAVRWRTPGSNAPNAMWMGLLCRVEERWDVYGASLLRTIPHRSFGFVLFHFVPTANRPLLPAIQRRLPHEYGDQVHDARGGRVPGSGRRIADPRRSTPVRRSPLPVLAEWRYRQPRGGFEEDLRELLSCAAR